MGLLSQLKSLLGLDSGPDRSGNDVDVTVEREPGAEPDASSEHAVKDPADEVEEPKSETEAYEEEIEEEAPAAGTDAAASTETLVDEENADDPEEAAEPAEAAGPTSAEDAIDEAESEGAVDEAETEAYEAEIEDESSAADTDAAASTETLVEEDNADEPDEAAEPAEAAGPSGELDQSTEHIKGIGPAYAETLAEAGVGTIADLAAVEDTEALSEETGLSAKRLGRWVDRARSYEP